MNDVDISHFRSSPYGGNQRKNDDREDDNLTKDESRGGRTEPEMNCPAETKHEVSSKNGLGGSASVAEMADTRLREQVWVCIRHHSLSDIRSGAVLSQTSPGTSVYLLTTSIRHLESEGKGLTIYTSNYNT